MSEINSIANGTFTIGQTSATNFQAGPGIKIDEPSAGTVRIGTDETVLFDSYGAGQSAANLSESMTNFESLKILLGNENTVDGTEWHTYEAKPDKIKNIWYCAGGGSNFYFICMYCSANTNTNITVSKEAAILKPFGSTHVNGQSEQTGYKKCIHKIVGINRISGGNE